MTASNLTPSWVANEEKTFFIDLFPKIPFPSGKKTKKLKEPKVLFPEDLAGDFDNFTTQSNLAHIHNFSTQPTSSSAYLGVNINNINYSTNSTQQKNITTNLKIEYQDNNNNNITQSTPEKKSQKISPSYDKLSPASRNRLLTHEAHLAAAFGFVNTEKPTFTIGGKVVIKNLEEQRSSFILPNKKEILYSSLKSPGISSPSNSNLSSGSDKLLSLNLAKEPLPQPPVEPYEDIFEFTPTPKKSRKRKRREIKKDKDRDCKKISGNKSDPAENDIKVKKEKQRRKSTSPKKIKPTPSNHNNNIAESQNISLCTYSNEVPILSIDNPCSLDLLNFTSPNLPFRSPSARKIKFLCNNNNNNNNNNSQYQDGVSQDILNSQILSCAPRCSFPSSAQVLETSFSFPSSSSPEKNRKKDDNIVKYNSTIKQKESDATFNDENQKLKKELLEMKNSVHSLTKKVQILTSLLEQHCPNLFNSVNTST